MARQSGFWMMAAAVLMLAGCGERNEDGERDAASDVEPQETAPDAQPAEPQALPAPDNVAKPPADATFTESGLAYVVLEDAGGTAAPRVSDTVTVHYTGWTTDGRMFDSSLMRGEPATFPLNQLIAGWQEAIPLMTVGDKYRFWIPGKLAYDNSPRRDAPRGTLVFDIELIAVEQEDVGSGTAAEDSDSLENRTEQL